MDKENNIYIIDNISLENLLRFYLSDGILYCSNNNDATENDIKIIDDVKTYDLCIDNNQRIHISCVLNSGKLVYLFLKDNKWHKNTLHTFPSDVNSIDQVKILTIDTTIHIFYNFRFISENIKFYNFKSLIVHGYKTECGWIQAYIGTFHQSTNPRYFVELDSNNNLHYFYLSHNSESSYINTLVFNSKKMRWIQAKNIELSILNAKLVEAVIDTYDKIHFLLKDINTEQFYHYSIDDSSNTNNKYTLIISNKDEYDFKMSEHNKKLCICWKSEDSISYITSDDSGETWKDILEHSLPKLIELIYYDINNEVESTKPVSSFGYIEDNEVFILGIDDIPTLEGNVIHPDTDNIDLSISETLNLLIDEEDNNESDTTYLDEINIPFDVIEDEYEEKEDDNRANTTSDNDKLDLNYQKPISIFDELNTKTIAKDEQSFWRKITNYLTLKE